MPKKVADRAACVRDGNDAWSDRDAREAVAYFDSLSTRIFTAWHPEYSSAGEMGLQGNTKLHDWESRAMEIYTPELKIRAHVPCSES